MPSSSTVLLLLKSPLLRPCSLVSALPSHPMPYLFVDLFIFVWLDQHFFCLPDLSPLPTSYTLQSPPSMHPPFPIFCPVTPSILRLPYIRSSSSSLSHTLCSTLSTLSLPCHVHTSCTCIHTHRDLYPPSQRMLSLVSSSV